MITSPGIPGTREIELRPDWVLTVDHSVDDEDIELSKKIEREISFRTTTIGSTAPPADFVPAAFVNGIIESKHKAQSMGWITNEGTVRSLDKKLDNLLKALQSGQKQAARNIAEAFVREVEAQGCEKRDCPPGKHINAEATALLKYNALYLIRQIK